MAPTDTAPRIPDHAVLRIIGRGSYGEIWLGRSLTGAFRAIKVVYRSTFESERSFAREFEGMSSFEPVSRDHDGFVDILHVGRADSFFYYIMELADDDSTGQPLPAGATAAEVEAYKPRTLKSALERRRRLPVDECLRLGASLAEALEDLHSHRLTHRDIKPTNIIFVEGRPKLADIGLVASVGQCSFVGTEGYVPPEGPGTAAADVYSLGKVLYEIAMGKDRLEFPALSSDLDRDPSRQRLLALNPVLLRACATNPADRYHSARDLCADLSALEQGRKPKRRFPLAAVIVAILLCAAAAVAWLYHGAPHRPVISDLRVDTVPPGAMVIFGDQMKRSPALFDSVEAGTYQLRIMLPGYDPVTATIDMPGTPPPFRLVRSKGAIHISADPPGPADFDLLENGKPIRHGALPASVEDLPTGSYDIVAHRAGRAARQTVDIESGRESSATLVFAIGHLSIRSDPAGAWISVDGADSGQAPATLDLPTGSHEIVARYRNWPESRQTVNVIPGQNPPVEFAFKNGSVKITSAPGGASVLQNGSVLGSTPLLIDEVAPGPVGYDLQLDGYKPASVTGTVSPGRQTFLATHLEMKRSPETGKPWTNSLGMKFVPDGPVYFAVWDTRVSDYAAFAAATGRSVDAPDFTQSPADPVVLVSWNDAEAFCKWLTQKEVQEGVIEEGQFYRLPTDAEWSAADGLPPEGGSTPEERDGKLRGVYPWGAGWPPPPGSGNFADESAGRRSGEKIIAGYKDGWVATSPVASFPPNRLGLYDMSGDVWQWVEDGYRGGGNGSGGAGNSRDWGVLRGGSWGTASRAELESGYRNVVDRNDRDVIYGFRCVLVAGASSP